MKAILPLIACLPVLLVSGCSSTWQYVHLPDQNKTIEDKSRARIYVIRSADSAGTAHVDVVDDKYIVGSTAPNGYLCWERLPGETMVVSESRGKSGVKINATAGEVYYLMQHVAPGRVYARTTLEMISPEAGRVALANCKPCVVRDRNGPYWEERPNETKIFVPMVSGGSFGGSFIGGSFGGGGVVGAVWQE